MSTTIIAECCQNHNGDLGILKDMIWAAAEAGADYVKIQSMLADELTQRERFELPTESSPPSHVKTINRPYQAEYNRLEPMDLDDDAHRWFIDECNKAGVKPLTTIFSHSRVAFLGSLDWDAVKVASYDCASYPLLRSLKSKFDHLFISTGAMHDHEIETAAWVLEGHSFTFLYCVTIYPTPLDAIQLQRLHYLRFVAYPNRVDEPVGFSDHTLVARDGLQASTAALAFGVDVIERHFTILPEDETRDGPISINPDQLKELVDLARLSSSDSRAFMRHCKKHVPSLCPLFTGYRDLNNRERVTDRAIGKLSREELLNRDYYHGRFASRNANDDPVQNWEIWDD